MKIGKEKNIGFNLFFFEKKNQAKMEEGGW